MSASTTAAEVFARAGAPGLVDVRNTAWRRVPECELALEPTPLDQQPSAYIQRSWAERRHGRATSVNVAAAVAGGQLLVHLRWRAPDPRLSATDINVYPDGCALLFPQNGSKADLATMGSPSQPVCGWHFRAGAAAPFVVTAKGLGTVEREKTHQLQVTSEWAASEWRVLFSRPVKGDLPPVNPGAALPFAVAIWTGAAEERAGLKAHTPTWHRLVVDSAEVQR